MKKSILKLFFVMTILLNICTLVSCKKDEPVESSFPEIVNSLTSYKLTGKLESNFPSGSKECNITTYYKNPNMYRVELQNPNTTETQVMIKNSTGVYVLVPSVNKTFKVNSSWPANSSYPYLLQSLSNDIVSDTNMISKKEGNNTTLELKAKLFNNDKKTTQKIVFDEENMPKEVMLYDENYNLLMRFVVTKIEQNVELESTLFEINDTQETLNEYYDKNPIEFNRLVRYPTYYPEGTSLNEEVITGTSETKLAIMKFTGADINYTIVQQFIQSSEENVCEYVNGDIYIMGGVFTFINDNNITFFDEGIQYTIASNTIDTMEMIKMGESLKATSEK